MGLRVILRETSYTRSHTYAHNCASLQYALDAILCTFVLVSSHEVLYLSSFVSRKVARGNVHSFQPRPPRSFSRQLSSRRYCRRLMAYFKRRNCSQFISGMQSATQRCARHPQSPNTISSPIKQRRPSKATPRWEFLWSSRLLISTLWHKLVAFQLLHLWRLSVLK